MGIHLYTCFSSLYIAVVNKTTTTTTSRINEMCIKRNTTQECHILCDIFLFSFRSASPFVVIYRRLIYMYTVYCTLLQSLSLLLIPTPQHLFNQETSLVQCMCAGVGGDDDSARMTSSSGRLLWLITLSFSFFIFYLSLLA